MAMNSGLRRFLRTAVFALVLTAAAWGLTPGPRGVLLLGQEPPPPPPTEKAQNGSSSKVTGQGSGQGSSSASGQAQGQEAPKDDSVAAAAKKVKKKEKGEPGKVYSEDDLSRLPAGAVSVFGQKPAVAEDTGKAKGVGAKADSGKGDKGEVAEEKDEFYWRKRARKILDPLEELNAEIERARDEAKKPVPSKKDSDKDDPNAVPTNDPKSVLQQLEKQKADLEKQLDALQDEGRRAGAPSEWFR